MILSPSGRTSGFQIGRFVPGRFPRTFFIVAMLSILYVIPTASASEGANHGIMAEDLLTIRDIKTMSVSPDGHHVAYQVFQADKDRNDYDVGWYVAATKPEAAPFLVADGGDAVPATQSLGRPNGEIYTGELVWSPDSSWFAYTLKEAGAVQIWRSRLDRVGREQLTHNAGDVEGLRFSTDGSKLFFAVGRNRVDITEANEKEARQGYLAQEPKIYDREFGPLWHPCSDDQSRWGDEDKPLNDGRTCTLTVWVFDRQTALERKATAGEIDAYYVEADSSSHATFSRGNLKDQSRLMETLSPDGKRLAWFENEDPAVFKGLRPPMWVTVSDGDKTLRCSADACRSTRPQNIWWSADGKDVIFLVRNGHHNSLNSLYDWKPGETGVRTILSGDDMFYDCGMTDNRLICGHESWTSPRKIVSVDLDDGEMTTIADINPDFRHFSFTRIEKILGEDIFGNSAHAHLIYPKGFEEGQRYPLVIVQYRSNGFLRGGVGDEQPIHVLAQNGFAVLSFDMPEPEVFFAKNGNLEDISLEWMKYRVIRRGPATAIERMVKELDQRGLIDPNRVGITGLSAGSITLGTALLTKNYAAASAPTSMMGPPGFNYSPSSRWSKSMDGAFGGTPFSKTGFAMRARHSVGMNASRIDTPFLIQVADREYYKTLQNYHALKAANKPVEMHIYPDEYHVKWQPAHRYAVYTRNVDWFNFWLRGVEDSDPAKAGQYFRWRSLRTQHRQNMADLKSIAETDAAAFH